MLLVKNIIEIFVESWAMAKRVIIKSSGYKRLDKQYKRPASNKEILTVEKDGEMSAEIQTLMPFSKYDIRMYAKNKIGMSVPSTPSIKIQTKEEAPEGPPTSIIAVSNSSQTLVVSWKVRQTLISVL